ncbi:MAG TPA: outer membrane beta-barrel protein [Caulobacteraceae bacterium]|nr:outer membrane beta-barrel protein [Caulobacteraceae bacterium]
MTNLKLLLGAASATLGLAVAGAAFADTPAAPAPTPMANPAMAGPIAANPHPATFDGGPIGTLTVDGVLTGGAIFQSNSAHNGFGDLNDDAVGGLTNAQVIINGSQGAFSFYIQAGAYNFPSLGTPYYKTSQITENTFGYVPQGFIKYQFNPDWSIEGGALPTLIGAEYTYTFQNFNIERGLLWNQEPAVSKGVQINYAHGPLAFSAAVTDGYYSDVYTSISGLVTYTFPNTDALAFAAQGNAGVARVATFATAEQQNNGQIYNLIFTHNMGPLVISPYLQYSNSPDIPGVSLGGDTFGVAVLGKYQFNPEWSLGGRVEYITSSGAANLLGYGVGSGAWSVTVTPTFQRGVFFARGELSYVGVSDGGVGLMFGKLGDKDSQFRGLLEAGIVF